VKIKVKYEVNERQRSETFSLEDLGYTEEQWKEMDEDKKREILMDAMVEQPYWAVDRFEEI
jgi:hypothetical protein